MRLPFMGRAKLLVLLASTLCFFAGATLGRALEQPIALCWQAVVSAAPSYGLPQALSAGDDYLPSVCVQGEYRWTEDKLPIKVHISSGGGVPGYRPQFDQMIRNAFDTWCNASGQKLSWTEVSDSKGADVVVSWTAQPTQRPNGTEAGETNAYAKLNHSTGQGIIYGATMQILTELNGKAFTDEFMHKTILHETGHALGLQGHSPVRTDIMYYAINNDQQTALTPRDVATMQHLYADYAGSGDIAAKPATTRQ